MKYLLDTHVLLWLLTDKGKLSVNIKSIIENTENTIYVSAISFWEISLKYSIGKLQLINYIPEDFFEASQKMGFNILPIQPQTCNTFHHLEANFHKDPFDRMLIWLSITENYTLLTCDANIKLYESIGLKTIW